MQDATCALVSWRDLRETGVYFDSSNERGRTMEASGQRGAFLSGTHSSTVTQRQLCALTVGDSGNKEKNENMASVLKELPAQISESALCSDDKVQDVSLERFAAVGRRGRWAKQLEGQHVGCVIHRHLSALQRKSVSLCSVISEGPRASSFLPVMWELFCTEAFASDSVWPRGAQSSGWLSLV